MIGCKSILIVEDDKDIRECLIEFLKFSGYAVMSAENGKEALDVLKNALPHIPGVIIVDLILLDLMMPVMTGQEFIDALQMDFPELNEKIPIIVLTALKDPDLRGRRVASILKKPIDLDVLLQKVEMYCGSPYRSEMKPADNPAN